MLETVTFNVVGIERVEREKMKKKEEIICVSTRE
jgi:hypothetical protein